MTAADETRPVQVMGGATWAMPAGLSASLQQQARWFAADQVHMTSDEIVDALVARYGGHRVGAEPPTAPASSRPSRAEYLMDIAAAVARRSTCSRLSVGAVLVRDGRILSTGYNGAPTGVAHCQHPDETPCRVAVHAETNAVAFAARHGAATEGATMFVTHSPCGDCAGLLINAGIRTVIYRDRYRADAGLFRLAEAGVSVVPLDG